MSYQRNYSTSINVSGTVSGHYPASEHGGVLSLSYNENVPVYINIHVDTDAFDYSCSAAEQSVDILTGAVIGMQGAQVAAITESANRVADHIIDGFFGMINSDITREQTENYSVLQAKFGLLMEHSKSVTTIHERMEQDMARLTRHYGDIFNGLDSDLEKRIINLNQSVFQLVEKCNEGIKGNILSQGAFGISQIAENNTLNSEVSTARLKNNISKVLSHIAGHINRNDNYKKTVESILVDDECAENNSVYIPAIFFINEGRSDTKTGAIEYYVCETEKKNDIIASIQYNFSRAGVPRTGLDDQELAMVEKEFMNMLENETQSQGDQVGVEMKSRIQQTIMKLWVKSKNNIYMG